MKNKKLTYLAAVICALSFSGCAHNSTEQKVDKELAQEANIKSHDDLQAEAEKIIETAPGLTDNQRVKLIALRDTTRTQLDSLYSQSLRLRSVLIKDLITRSYNEDEVELLKTRIKNVEDKRLSLMFSALEQANLILGHEILTNRQVIMDSFFKGQRTRN